MKNTLQNSAWLYDLDNRDLLTEDIPFYLEYAQCQGGEILDKTTPRLIQFHTLKNAVNPPFLGGFLFSGTVAA